MPQIVAERGDFLLRLGATDNECLRGRPAFEDIPECERRFAVAAGGAEDAYAGSRECGIHAIQPLRPTHVEPTDDVAESRASTAEEIVRCRVRRDVDG
jgi:hypothetical protein